MKTVLLEFIIIAIFASAVAALGAESGKRVSTNHNFNDMSVNGRYQSAAEAIATVEDEKEINDLLVVRKDFKDRLKSSLRKK